MMEIILELSDPVVCSKNAQCLVYSIKFLATGLPVAKTLLKYNSYRLEENEEEENKSIKIELSE